MIRQPTPEVDYELVQDSFEKYVKQVGVKMAFDLFGYNKKGVTSAVCGRSLSKLVPLLEVILKVTPTAMIRYSVLKRLDGNGCNLVSSLFVLQQHCCAF